VPSPNGFFFAAFFQSCRDAIKEDVMKVFLGFHERGKFVKSLNVTLISLIPKKVGVVEIRDFHPISLVSGIYKIIAKVLANRLKFVMEHIISKTQNAFIGGC
jgi:hypothetical protein